MTAPVQTPKVRAGSRLRLRMAISYIAVTLLIVLLLESLVVGAIFFVATRSPLPAYWMMQTSGHAAQVYALQASIHAESETLDPNTTFEQGQPSSLTLQRASDPPELSWFNLDVPYVAPGSAAPERAVVALLIDADEQVLASSYPDRFPEGSNAIAIIPEDATLIRSALQGRTDGAVHDTAQGMHASVAHTVWSEEQEPLGVVYIQAPAGGPPDANLVTELASVLIPSGVLWLCLMLPIGMVFGVFTTRGLIRRIERLAGATARFKEGDTSQRVPVSRKDEIGQLEQQFNEMAEQLVESFVQRQAMAAQSARREERARIEQEMSSAHYIQRSLLPEALPEIPGWQIMASYFPAAAVGGDLYDVLSLPDDRMGIFIGDATGKGVPSALIMATTCAMLRAAASSTESPGQALTLVNNLLLDLIPSATFATCFYAILNPDEGRLFYANAGHNVPYLSRNGSIVELEARGMPLGLMPEQVYEEDEMMLAADDCLLFYTDGLVEAHNPEREMYGSGRLKRLLQDNSADDGLIELLLDDLWAFAGAGWEQEDDVTLLLLKKTA